jgi:hypothetical protein
MLSHVAYLDASRYYIEWFKTGMPPAISADNLFYFYRLHPATLPITVNPADEAAGHGRPIGADALRDHLFVTAFLTAPAQLTLHSGAASKTFDLPAGVQHVSMPFEPGIQRFVLQRDGLPVFDKTGEHEISLTDVFGKREVIRLKRGRSSFQKSNGAIAMMSEQKYTHWSAGLFIAAVPKSCGSENASPTAILPSRNLLPRAQPWRCPARVV